MISGILAALVLGLQTHPAAGSQATCLPVDHQRNASRAWSDFEFSTEIEGGPMWLAGRGCYARAGEAAREYLARGPLLSVREQAITQLHLGRNLAFAGDEAAAAQAVA